MEQRIRLLFDFCRKSMKVRTPSGAISRSLFFTCKAGSSLAGVGDPLWQRRVVRRREGYCTQHCVLLPAVATFRNVRFAPKPSEAPTSPRSMDYYQQGLPRRNRRKSVKLWNQDCFAVSYFCHSAMFGYKHLLLIVLMRRWGLEILFLRLPIHCTIHRS